jgi:hypothetical protein
MRTRSEALVLPIEKCTALVNGVECGQPVEEDFADLADPALLRVFRCDFGHRSYAMVSPVKAERIREQAAGIPPDRIGFDIIQFRKRTSEQTWHLTSSCSHWPTENFISSTALSHTDPLCNECLATSSKPK